MERILIRIKCVLWLGEWYALFKGLVLNGSVGKIIILLQCV